MTPDLPLIHEQVNLEQCDTLFQFYCGGLAKALGSNAVN